MTGSKRRLDLFLNGWIKQSIRFCYWIAALFPLAGVLALLYTLNNISISTDTRDMLSRELDWRELDLAYENEFPMYVDTVLVVVEADTPDQAADAAQFLQNHLQQTSDHYQEIYYAAGLEYFRKSALLYLEHNELQDLSDQLAAIQPFLGQLVQDQSLRGLFTLIEKAVEARRDGQEIEVGLLFDRVRSVTAATRQGVDKYLSWQSLITGETESDSIYREYIVINPKIDYASLLPGETAINAIRDAVKSSDAEQQYGVNVRLTGSATLAYDELKSVSQGAGLAAILALLAVTIILTVGLRSVRLIIATLITLIIGLLLTAGMATATVGELNLISVAFAVLYIGLGVDFAIHFCLRFRELHIHEETYKALLATGTSVGRSLFLCALTTAVGLYAFIPTDYRGIAELGWISGTGMFISLIVTLTLLPALLALMPPAADVNRPTYATDRWISRIIRFPERRPRTIYAGTILLALASLVVLPSVHFDSNSLNLQARNLESVQTYRDMIKNSRVSPMSGIVLTQDKQDAQQLSDTLKNLEQVHDVRSVWDYIPDNQDAKLTIIDDLDLLLGGTLSMADSDTSATTPGQRRAALTGLRAYLDENPPGADEPALARLHEELINFQDTLENSTVRADQKFALLERHLLQNLPGRLHALASALTAEKVEFADLPAALSQRWVSPDGWYLLEIQPSQNLLDEGAMRSFVEAVRSETPNLIGAPVIQLEAGDSVVDAFIEAFTLALSVITLLLIILLRSAYDAVLALMPILLAALLTAAGTVVLDIPFNFANIIALPLLLGIGIDNSIHILHRHRMVLPSGGSILHTSSARAIMVSALTTICSIGNLAFSSHLGTASMGLLLTLGITMSLLCALILLPVLLSSKQT